MTEILTITLNPSLDLSATTESVTPGPKLRLDEPVAEPGGGGINVARALLALGGQARAVAALGGITGARFQALLADSGVTVAVFPVPGETRQSLAVTDSTTKAQYRFVLPGPQWSDTLVSALLRRLVDHLRGMEPGAVAVLSGSQPPGVPETFPADLVAAAPTARVIVDTSGAALTRLVAHPVAGARPYVLRMDHHESETLANCALPDVASSLDYAQGLVQRGVAEIVILARGAEGSVLATHDLRLHCQPPLVQVVSKVGAGDSFTGAFALAVAQGQDLALALRFGTAAAAAAVMTPGSQLCRAADVAQCIPACQLATCL